MRSFAALLLIVATTLQAAPRSRVALRETPEDPAAWVRRNSLALEHVPHIPWVRSARIVALGDATHGTHEFFATKQPLIESLVLDHGFRTIAFEGPYAEFEAIRRYVASGEGNAEAAMTMVDYFFWYTDEVMEIIEWARAQNAGGLQPPIEIAGVDVAHPHAAANEVLAYVAGSSIEKSVVGRFECLMQFEARPWLYSGGGGCHESIAAVRTLLETTRAELVARTSIDAFERALHAARVVEQGEETLVSDQANRDSAMAENISWLEGRSDGGVIVWGHNEHFGKRSYELFAGKVMTSAGEILDAHYGDSYVAIATLMLRGLFWAYNGGVMTMNAMQPAPAEDWASLIGSAGSSGVFVNLRAPLASWLRTSHPMRIGASSTASRTQAALEIDVNLPAKFDGVIYFENTTPSRLRHMPELP
jgi:erythromycin esterase